jgi:hypothetical protein
MLATGFLKEQGLLMDQGHVCYSTSRLGEKLIATSKTALMSGFLFFRMINTGVKEVK